ncbi:hypothetical protein Taro_007595 [Colocasia esculenta]|uniref:F-box domain-containing protein n=1 Tax=Colocasia esculenta TaxID=4460 RepID=A0A843TUL1_COLES|nr:hypothetical protein [Colocasia esculenta]
MSRLLEPIRRHFWIQSLMTEDIDCTFGKLPDHLLIEIFVRIPICEWAGVSCVRKQWAALFQGECLWKTALVRTWPMAAHGKRWPGPICRGLSKSINVMMLIALISMVMYSYVLYIRRYAALYVSEHIVPFDGEVDELVGHVYLYLKEQIEHSTVPPSSGVLHGTIIGEISIQFLHLYFLQLTDQFIACGKSRDRADELASQIWIAVIDHLEENEHTFLLLKHLAQENEVFLPYPYSRSYRVQWKVFEKLFTDFRDCFRRADYYDVLAYAKYKFQTIPSNWLGY